jgi:hypothetical protein
MSTFLRFDTETTIPKESAGIEEVTKKSFGIYEVSYYTSRRLKYHVFTHRNQLYE